MRKINCWKNKIGFIVCLLILCVNYNVRGEEKIPKESIWDTGAIFTMIPKVFSADDLTSPYKNVKAIFYEGLLYKGKQTRVFAWYGAPDVEKGEKVPAIVLVHGGGATALDAWVDLWVSRGYAAIAMDLCGCIPSGSYATGWARHKYGGPAGWDNSFAQMHWKTEDQWVYHAIADIILANSLLRSFPEVDPDRIGMTGVSWGGYLACIAAGVDSRFKFAVSVYGCGFLYEDSSWAANIKNMGLKNSEKWIKLWDPSSYLGNAKMPMFWVAGTNDVYPLGSLQKSYRLPKSPRTLCIRVRMPHGHGGPGENPEEIRAFADSIFNDGEPLARITEQGRDGDEAWIKFSAKTSVEEAELNYTKDGGDWKSRKWETVPAELDESKNMVSAVLPEGVTAYYFNIIDRSDLVVSSEHEEIK